MSYSQVILVDDKDREIGVMEKMQAHVEGKLHRAFSVLVFNSRGEMLIHKRAEGKYHSAGLWTNACCSHPQPLEDTARSAERRLKEEMGLEAKAEFMFKFLYRVDFDNGLIENELDHVYIAQSNSLPRPNPAEVSDYRYISIEDLYVELYERPEDFTFWFRQIMDLYRLALVENG